MSENDQLDSENLIRLDATQKEITFNFVCAFRCRVVFNHVDCQSIKHLFIRDN